MASATPHSSFDEVVAHPKDFSSATLLRHHHRQARKLEHFAIVPIVAQGHYFFASNSSAARPLFQGHTFGDSGT